MHQYQAGKLDAGIPKWVRDDLKERFALTEEQLAIIRVSAMDDENWESRLIFQLVWHRHRAIEIINSRFGTTGGSRPDLVLVPILKGRHSQSYTVYKIEGSVLVRVNKAVGYNAGRMLLSHRCDSCSFYPEVVLQKIINRWYRDTDVTSDKKTLSALRYSLL
ncbi:hypothetical protein T3H00_04925 [Pseudomonas fluorescens]|uniref:hypothetical protein n=1 Tax=Pseudomonas fluorescens TaxID=294 RepID=UPI002ACABB4A|nr:hypothetical protein [Pseudomonas fluorescens]MDZ5432006.1 hypothetical protein [Pseudomonas fluorescens]